MYFLRKVLAAWLRGNLRFDVEKIEEVFEVQGAFGNFGKAGHYSFQETMQTLKRTRQKSKHPYCNQTAHGLEGNQHISTIIRHRAESSQQKPPKRAFDHNFAIGYKILMGEFFEAFDDKIGKVEDFDLLGGFVAGANEAQVIQLPSFGRPVQGQGIGLLVEVRFTQKRRDHRDDQDQNQPRIEGHQTRAQKKNGDDVLKLSQYLRHQYSSVGSLAASTLQLVVKLGVFKLKQVQLGCVLHDIDRGSVGDQVTKQVLRQANTPVEKI